MAKPGALLVARGTLSILAGFAFMVGASPQQPGYPVKPVRMIVSSTQGQAIDVLARHSADWLSRRMGQPFVAENRPGGQSSVGGAALVAAAADGHTLLVASQTTAYLNLFVKDLSYDWTRDIAPVARIAGQGYVLVTSAAVPATTLAEFVTHAKANPGRLNHGVAGSLVPEYEDIKNRLGIDLVRVPYKGGAPTSQALLANEVQLQFTGVATAITMTQAGKARALAYTGLRRHPDLPAVPTLAEQALPGYEASFWIGLFAPGATPPAIVARLNAEINEMNKDAATLERYRALGAYEAYAGTPAAMRAAMLEIQQHATRIVTQLGIKPD